MTGHFNWNLQHTAHMFQDTLQSCSFLKTAKTQGIPVLKSLLLIMSLLRKFLLTIFLAVLILFFKPVAGMSDTKLDPLSEWAVEEGYSLKIAASGFELPTAIAIVKNPKPGPKSPKMFVTELRGAIKLVSNDSTVTTFARIPTFSPKAEWPDEAGEAGMAGLCLDDEHGYVFTTYAYRDKWGVLRNGMSRFTATPHTFEGKASERQDYLELFKDDVSAFSHQIGGCVVDGDSIYIGVGDGGEPSSSRSVDKMLGKLVRLTLDGKPHPLNPFASSGLKPASVYAFGLRNPFGLTVVDNRVFVAENGVGLDRFLEIQAGRDYAWDGTDNSIATNAAAVFSPTICPVQVAFAPVGQNVLEPKQNPRFLIASSETKRRNPGVVSVEFDLNQKMVVGSPRYLAHFVAKKHGQGVVGLALSNEGLYFCPILPVGNSGVVLVMRYEPNHAHSHIIGPGTGPAELINTLNCLKCHSLNGIGNTQGPALDKNSLETRVESRVLDPTYADLIARLDANPDRKIQGGRAARKEVLSAKPKDRVNLWVINRLLYPSFDEPNAQMPPLNLTREQAEVIALYLLQKPPEPTVGSVLASVFASPKFWAGLGIGLFFGLGFAAVFAIRSKRRVQGRKGGP